MPYYPTQNFILGLATIRRERRLPPNALGEVAVRQDQNVTAQDVVLRGTVPGDFIMLNPLPALGLKKPEQITEEMWQAQPGTSVQRGQVLASNGTGRRARTLKSPVNAVVVRLEPSQVILQITPDPMEVLAMCPGQVTSIRGTNEILLETVGALIQCAWGNGKQAFTAYRMEPEEGLESLRGKEMVGEYRNSAIVMDRPILAPNLFLTAATLELNGLIVPSMHADLREIALRQTIPVIVTEGFGEQQMSESVYNLLRDNLGRPAFLDATEPQRWLSSRPEIVIPLPSGGITPPPPEADQPLVEGAIVRISRAPYAGMSGRVRKIVEVPRAVENGLRLPGAEIAISGGRTVFVPLANIVMLGRSGDATGTGGA